MHKTWSSPKTRPVRYDQQRPEDRQRTWKWEAVRKRGRDYVFRGEGLAPCGEGKTFV